MNSLATKEGPETGHSLDGDVNHCFYRCILSRIPKMVESESGPAHEVFSAAMWDGQHDGDQNRLKCANLRRVLILSAVPDPKSTVNRQNGTAGHDWG